MELPPPTTIPDHPAFKPARGWILWLLLVLTVAAVPRIADLERKPYVLDESWTREISTGRASLHQHLPFNRIIDPPPPFFSLAQAPAWWHIWTHMEITHPPLYSILLRWWEDLLGDGDLQGRLLSVVASLFSIAFLFDVIRLQAGVRPAVWAALLMALATHQVEYARITRDYTVLEAFALLVVDLVTRIELNGASPLRWLMLCTAVLCTLLTHYFCLGTLVGIALFCLRKLPRSRRSILWAFAIAAMLFAISWAPFMWQQRHLFATDDPSTLFLTSGQQHHIAITFMRIAAGPIQLLTYVPDLLAIPAAICGVCLYLGGFVPRFSDRIRWAPLWGLWLSATVAVVAALDFTRETDHLYFIRYILLAGPAVYALIPLLLNSHPRMLHAVCGLILIACCRNLPSLWLPAETDPRQMAREMLPAPGPADLLIIAAPPEHQTACEDELLCLSRYLPQPTCPVALLTEPATADVLARARRSRFVYLITETPDYQGYLPGAKLLHPLAFRGLGNLWILQMDQPGHVTAEAH